MHSFGSQKQALLSLGSKARQLAKALRRDEQAAELEAVLAMLQRSVYRVVFAGEYKRGKSSLINNLLSLSEAEHVTPVNVDVATSVAIRIYQAKAPTAVVHYEPVEGRKPEPIAIRDIRNYATEQGNPGNKRKVAFIEVGIPSPLLADGLEFIDTPGVGGLNSTHSEVTYLVLPKADQAVHVSHNESMSKAELDFVRIVLRNQKNPLFVITKRDLAKDWAAAAADLRMKLGAFINPPPDATQVYSVSNASYEVFLATGDADDLRKSGFPELRNALSERIDRARLASVVVPAHFQIIASLQAMERLSQSQLDGHRARSDQEIQDKRQQLSAKRARLDRLREQPSWYDTLNTGLAELRVELSSQLDQLFIDLSANVERYAADEYYHENPDAIDVLINSELSIIATSVSSRLEQGAKAVYARIIEMSKLDVSAVAAEYAAQRRGAGAMALKNQSQGLISSMFDIFRGTWQDTTIGAAVGSIFSPIGTAVGAVVGFLNGIGRVLRGWRLTKSEQIRRQLLAHYGPLISKAKVDYRSTLETSLSKVGALLRDGIRQAVEKEARQAAEQSKELEDGLRLTQETALKEIRRVEGEMAEIRSLLQQCKAVAESMKV